MRARFFIGQSKIDEVELPDELNLGSDDVIVHEGVLFTYRDSDDEFVNFQPLHNIQIIWNDVTLTSIAKK